MASYKPQPISYSDGVVSGGIFEVPATKFPHLPDVMGWKYHLHVTTNRQVWSYEIRPGWIMTGERSSTGIRPTDLVPAGVRAHFGADPDVKEVHDWAIKDAVRKKIQPFAPQAVSAEQGGGSVKLPGPRGPISYFGYGKKIGAYTLQQIHEIISKAVADCSATWKWDNGGMWSPSNLQVKIHAGKTAMGLAFNPGSGRELNKRVISLNKLAFTSYSAEAIWRVVVHEICHHYRDEALPTKDFDDDDSKVLRSQLMTRLMANKGFAGASVILNSHDIRFVKALGQVDPDVAAKPIEGCWFAEYVDKSVVAVVETQKGIQWAAGAGFLSLRMLSDRRVAAAWVGEWGKHSLGHAGIENKTERFMPFADLKDKIPEGFDQIQVYFDDKLRVAFERIYARSAGESITLPNQLPMVAALPLARALWI